ncbi:MAG TPA: aminoglycoside adenylyltransferase domain-containing protein [Gaiellales bacterium]
MDGEARAYAGAVAAVLQAALGGELAGLYLHGSATLGDYDPARSDIDLLAVCAAPIDAATRAALISSLDAAALPCPAVGLEFSLITRAAALDASPAPAYELHGWDAHGRLHPDDGRGDRDLPRHYALVRAAGVAVFGPDPSALLREVPVGELVALTAAEIEWAVANAGPSTQVLTACRAWRLVTDGGVCSKRQAAEWALAHGAPQDVVAPVLAAHLAAVTPAVDRDAVAAFVASVRARLEHK